MIEFLQVTSFKSQFPNSKVWFSLVFSFLLKLGAWNLGIGTCSAQPYANSWINYSQTYLEFKITEEGVYKINYNTLVPALNNIGISSFNPQNIQIFARGEEQYIYIEGESDGNFDAGDFIEFYATKNDGFLDAQLYVSPSYQSNPFYSIFNDTASYYLTVSSSVNGKRMTVSTATNFSAYTPLSYFFKEEIFIPSQLKFYQGEYQSGAANPLYTEGKGWFTEEIGNQQQYLCTLNTSSPQTQNFPPDAVGNIVYAGVNANWHSIQINYGSSGNLLITDAFPGYQLKKQSFTIPTANLGNSNTVFTYKSLTAGTDPDYTALSHIYLKYPRTLNFSGVSKMMLILPARSDTSLINSLPSSVSYLYDLTSHVRIPTSPSQAAVFPSNTERKVFFITTNMIQNITTLTKVTSSAQFFDYSSLDPDSAFVIITHSSLMSGASDYKNYRTTIGREAILADIDELYDQFAYGINKHPLAIRNFCDFISDTWTVPPQHLFLLGKGISDAALNTRNDGSLYAQNLVPTFGWPSSDAAFTSGLNGTVIKNFIPTGRLAAKNYDDVKNYLDKVKAHEQNLQETPVTQISIPDRIWMKEVLHFAGGQNITENTNFNNYLKSYENIIEDTLYGGNVRTYSKYSTQAVIINQSVEMKARIDSGVSIMTFFGHSTSFTTDISIGSASEYNNAGRYHLIISNGCFSGDIFTSGSQSTSEDFVLTANKGAIAYVATAGLGFESELDAYTKNLYTHIGKKSYNKGIGLCMKEGIGDYVQQSGTGSNVEKMSLGMILHGDPAVLINTHNLPDYAIAPQYVFFTPQDVTTADDSFNLNLVISNLGMAIGKITDSLSVVVRRKLPSGSEITYDTIIPPVFYVDTFVLKLPVDQANGPGINLFYIKVDHMEYIPEISEFNNEINYNAELYIKSTDLIPIYPYNYAVVPNKSFALKASTADPFAPSREYIFQIDTNDSYNSSSPKFKQYTVVSSGGVVKWNIDTNYFNEPDSTAFFWRTSPNTPSDYRWREHTFQKITGKTGWGQKHFFQYKNDDYVGIEYKKPERKIDFLQQVKGIRCNVFGNPTLDSLYKFDKIEYLIDDIMQDYNLCSGESPVMMVAIMDSCLLEPWETKKLDNGVLLNPNNDFGNANNMNDPCPWTQYDCNCRGRPEKYFMFVISEIDQMNALRYLLDSIVPVGNYVLAYTGTRGMFQNSTFWDNSHFQAFENLGADSIRFVPDSIPYIFFAKKGYPNSAKEVIGTFPFEYISLIDTMYGCTGKGTVTTPAIGPSYEWGSLHWEYKALGDDSVKIDVLNDVSGTAVSSYNSYAGNIIPLNNDVNASQSPYIKLQANISDTVASTCAQPSYWYVLYDEIPEAALNAAKAFSFHDDSLQQGDSLKFSIAIENVSRADMDSLRIKYWIENSQNYYSALNIKKNDSLRAWETMYDTVMFPTRNLSGNCRFWIEVNPQDSLWQLEQYHFNNLATLAFSAQKDIANPLLDVTFDGVHILNGDIVSPKPEIIIQLKDENKFLALDDTGKFIISIVDPDKKISPIYFSEGGKEVMRFNKAELPDNKCTIEYHPVFAKDGIYELRVQGSDASDNKAGDLDYSIKFEIINKSTITEILNYPNPFSTSTRFVFTLTGAEIPDYFKIQILTVSGKVVREITRNELGTIHIGRNITDYAWNGTDEYGDPLANGVYFYRAIVKISGEEIEHRSTNADQFFKKGFGKMYLMR